MTGQEAKSKLRAQGLTLKQWALDHGFEYVTVSRVVRGVQKGNYGIGHEIAVALGMKKASANSAARGAK